MQSVSLRESAVLRALREESSQIMPRNIQIAPEQAQLLQLLIELTGAKRIVEIGTYMGYSALAMALALPPEGHLITCDIDARWREIAGRYWHQAGVDKKIEFRLGPALETLKALTPNSVDMIFIDADKGGYDAYYERGLTLVRPGGLICIDNVLWSGRLADPQHQDKTTRALRALNQKLYEDTRITLSLLPMGDGLTLARKSKI
ncbi:MAG: O-methyltransferase [Gammaproteobacteria bacterium]